MKKRFTVTAISLFFSIIGVISTFTFVFPILFMIPCYVLESILTLFLGSQSFKITDVLIIIILIIIFLISTYFYIKSTICRPEKLKYDTILYFTFQFFIIPSLFFYVNTTLNWENTSDGQSFFNIFEFFPISCSTFFFLGILIDFVRISKKMQMKLGKTKNE